MQQLASKILTSCRYHAYKTNGKNNLDLSFGCGVYLKNTKLCICVNFKKLNVWTKKGSMSFKFNNYYDWTWNIFKILDGYLKYPSISISLKDKYKITFVNDYCLFIWQVMLFRVKNKPLVYKKLVSKYFI